MIQHAVVTLQSRDFMIPIDLMLVTHEEPVGNAADHAVGCASRLIRHKTFAPPHCKSYNISRNDMQVGIALKKCSVQKPVDMCCSI